MKKTSLLGILLLSAGIIKAENSKVKWNELEVQTMNFDKEIIIKDGRILRKGNYDKGKFVEKSNAEIISEDNEKICTKKECVYINENNMPIIELENGKIEEGSWSFGPAKLKLERAMTNYDK